MKKLLGIVTLLVLLLTMAGCTEDSASKEPTKQVDTQVAEAQGTEKNEEVSKEIEEMPKGIDEAEAKEFYELFSKKIITIQDNTVPKQINDFYDPKVLENQMGGFVFGRDTENEHPLTAPRTYYQGLLQIIGMPLQSDLEMVETHTYSNIENSEENMKMQIDYELVIGDKTYNEKREVTLTQVEGEIKIEKFEALESPLVDAINQAA